VVLASLALTLALAVTALAWSEGRAEPRHDAGLRLSAAGALRIGDSRGGGAILTAPALAPGSSVGGRVTIRNRGAAARLLLSRAHLLERPGADDASLARALRLRIHNVTPGSRTLVYHGALAAMPTLHLGLLSSGARRDYRFVVRLPETGFVENGLAGSRVRFDYRWQLRRQ
jgi:hypothetical protein